MLSGFVIHYNYATLVRAGGFCGTTVYLWARFARLYSLFLLMLLGYPGEPEALRILDRSSPNRPKTCCTRCLISCSRCRAG